MSKIDELIQQLCPNGVEYRRLNEICNMRGRIGFRGYTRRDLVAPGQGAISLSPSNISNGVVSYSNCTYISWDKYDESPEIKVNIGDIIFTKTASVGKTALIKSLPAKATINPQLVLITATNCNSAYLSYVLQGKAFQDEVLRMTGIGSVPNISQANLGSIEIPLPPLPIQEEIVRILDAFTSHAAELQAELQARREQYEYYRNKLLSFEDDSSVEWKKLGEICEKAKAIDWKSTNISFDYIDLSSVDIQKSSIGDCTAITTSNAPSRAQQIVREGDILFGKTRPTLMRFAVVPKRYNEQICSTGFCVIRVNSEVCNRFVYHYLRSGKFLLYVSENQEGAGYPSITDKKIMKFTVPIPPLSEQRRIVAILDKFEALVNDLTEGLPAEIAARQEQYEYYRDRLLSFPKAV